MADDTPAVSSISMAHLLSLGMFVFGMDTLPYQALERTMRWRHEETERFLARAVSQYAGPGPDNITISGKLVPEIAGTYSSFGTITDMADTGGNWPLMDGTGSIWGNFRIDQLHLAYQNVMAGGVPRAMEFSLDLTRVS